ncbi:hypothetical protein [Pseudoclavibacter sp. AY1F1]|uniref:hypothetical protein n=1 Tax=Pseudoclavibacter sp. AY1F1 TaxID=2080583 RepID=UPI0015E3FF86|nr:hypothetical protein [Pseudoclavibacter sp. AY1F1]
MVFPWQSLEGDDRRALRLHVGEPVRLGPAVAAKKECALHVETVAQLLRQVEEFVDER